MTKKILFGTDGWRGIIAEDFTFPNLRRAVAGSAIYFKQHPSSQNAPVIIGYDRRFFSRQFAESVGSGLKQQGFQVKLSKTSLPTPALTVSVVHQKASWGIMLTASHNPAIYNGFKLKEASGRSAPPEVTQAIEQLIPEQDPGESKLSLHETLPTFDYFKPYEAYLKKRLDWKTIQRFHARIVLDHMFGTAAGIPEMLLKKSALKWTSLHAQADPLFGGLHPEPVASNLGPLQQEIKRQRALVGFAFDGDADRLGVVDDRGECLTPHQVFPLLLLYCLEQKGWRGKVVQSVSLGALGERMAQTFGLPFEEVPVGFKHVAQRMITEQLVAGGEESGGYAFKGSLPERDGILNALFFLEMLAITRKKPSELVRSMEKRFGAARFKRKDIPLKHPIGDKALFIKSITSQLPDRLVGSSVRQVRTQDGIKVVLADGAWVLMRPSGTEPLLRTYAESDQWSRTERLLTAAQQWTNGAVK